MLRDTGRHPRVDEVIHKGMKAEGRCQWKDVNMARRVSGVPQGSVIGPCCFYYSLTTCQTKSNTISSCLQTTQIYLRQSIMRKTNRTSLKIRITWRTGQNCGR